MSDEYVRWKASQARCWAISVRDAVKARDAAQATLDEFIRSADGLKAMRYDKVGGPSTSVSGDGKMVEVVARMDEIIDAVCQQTAVCADYVTEFQTSLGRVDFLHRAILQLHYVRCMTWDNVAEVVGYAPEYVRNELSVYALAALYEVMPLQYKTVLPRADE